MNAICRKATATLLPLALAFILLGLSPFLHLRSLAQLLPTESIVFPSQMHDFGVVATNSQMDAKFVLRPLNNCLQFVLVYANMLPLRMEAPVWSESTPRRPLLT